MGLGWTLGGGGRGGGTFRPAVVGASNGESSQFVVGVYRLGFPVPTLFGGGAGAGLAGTADFCIWRGVTNERRLHFRGKNKI